LHTHLALGGVCRHERVGHCLLRQGVDVAAGLHAGTMVRGGERRRLAAAAVAAAAAALADTG